MSYSGGTYTQNFDGLPTNVTNASQVLTGTTANGPFDLNAVTAASGLAGWQLGNYGGSSADTEFRSQDGSLSGSAGRGVLSLGTGGSTERALGALTTSNQIGNFGLVVTNNTAFTFGSFTLSFVGEQWRRGDVATPDTLQFSYGSGTGINGLGLISYPTLSLSSPNTQVSPTNVAINGNLAANQASVSGTAPFIWAPGQTLVLKWVPTDLSGQDDALAIDNLNFTANIVPEPSSICLILIGLISVSSYRLRNRAIARRQA